MARPAPVGFAEPWAAQTSRPCRLHQRPVITQNPVADPSRPKLPTEHAFLADVNVSIATGNGRFSAVD
jgi:hypothetical protein